jgi:hypothetical protein
MAAPAAASTAARAVAALAGRGVETPAATAVVVCGVGPQQGAGDAAPALLSAEAPTASDEAAASPESHATGSTLGAGGGSPAEVALAAPTGVVRAEVEKLERQHALQLAALKGELAAARADAESARLALRRLRYRASRAAAEARSRRASAAGDGSRRGSCADGGGALLGALPVSQAGEEEELLARDAAALAIEAAADEVAELAPVSRGPEEEDPLVLQQAVIGVLQSQVVAAQQLALERGAAVRDLERIVRQLSSAGADAAAARTLAAADGTSSAASRGHGAVEAGRTNGAASGDGSAAAAVPEAAQAPQHASVGACLSWEGSSSSSGSASSSRSDASSGASGTSGSGSSSGGVVAGARKRPRRPAVAEALAESSPERRCPLLGPAHLFSDALDCGAPAALVALAAGSDFHSTSDAQAPPPLLRSPSPGRLALEARLALRGSAAQSRLRSLLVAGGLSSGGVGAGVGPLLGTLSDDGSVTLERSPATSSAGASPPRRSTLGAAAAPPVRGSLPSGSPEAEASLRGGARALSADSSVASALHHNLQYMPFVDAPSEGGSPAAAGCGGAAHGSAGSARGAEAQPLRWELAARAAQVRCYRLRAARTGAGLAEKRAL